VDFGLYPCAWSWYIGTNVFLFSSGCSCSYCMFLWHCRGCLVYCVWVVSWYSVYCCERVFSVLWFAVLGLMNFLYLWIYHEAGGIVMLWLACYACWFHVIGFFICCRFLMRLVGILGNRLVPGTLLICSLYTHTQHKNV
jgi:hypothetical protein